MDLSLDIGPPPVDECALHRIRARRVIVKVTRVAPTPQSPTVPTEEQLEALRYQIDEGIAAQRR